MRFTAEVEMSTNGCGDNGYPTRIKLVSDCSGNYFDVSTESCGHKNPSYSEESVEIRIRGEWEAERFGDMFIWIGEELNRIKAELIQ